MRDRPDASTRGGFGKIYSAGYNHRRDLENATNTHQRRSMQWEDDETARSHVLDGSAGYEKLTDRNRDGIPDIYASPETVRRAFEMGQQDRAYGQRKNATGAWQQFREERQRDLYRYQGDASDVAEDTPIVLASAEEVTEAPNSGLPSEVDRLTDKGQGVSVA